jgi:hypothetical protein
MSNKMQSQFAKEFTVATGLERKTVLIIEISKWVQLKPASSLEHKLGNVQFIPS